MTKKFTHRLAQMSDVEDIKALMAAAIYELQKNYLTKEQLEIAGQFMGVDTQLIEDQTYFLILNGEGTDEETIVGCGGWGKRKTLYGGNHTPGRSDELLDPATDRARIRAMYCHPDWARNGIGRYIMSICEQAARDAGFNKMILGSTLAGQPLYEACGYQVIEHGLDKAPSGVTVPVLTMTKDF
ncbi:MAG: GNAT family N-acetyltransferase [Kordiimonadaceae bacterium]|nr:GNAT family N-acetyltransferase [Kordiimonadaceae bacterium]